MQQDQTQNKQKKQKNKLCNKKFMKQFTKGKFIAICTPTDYINGQISTLYQKYSYQIYKH